MSEQKKWNCDCREYLEKELEKLEPWQVNAKKKIEELLASVECPYKLLDRKNNENFRCNLDPAKSPELGEAGRYTQCECGKTVRNNKAWVDKTGEFWTRDDGWEDHLKNCPVVNQIQSNTVENDKQINYLPWILGGVGILGLIGVLVYLLTRKGENK